MADTDLVPTSEDRAPDWPPHIGVRSALLTAIFILLLFYTLYLAAEILIPITLALLLSLLLSPMINQLEQLRIRPALSAAVAVLGIMALVGGALYWLAEPASSWIQQAPSAIRDLEQTAGAFLQPFDDIQQAADQVGKMANNNGTPADVVEVKLQTMTFADWMLDAAPTTLAGFATTIILLYFMLASGDQFLRRLVEQISRFDDKKATVDTVRVIQSSLSRYLYTISLINLALGASTAAALYLLAVPNPVLWGAVAAVANFAPYVGPIFMLGVLSLVGLVSFDTLGQAALPPAAYFVLTAVEGQIITPAIAGRNLELNPVAMVLTIIFLGWIWGFAGVLVAVPVLVSTKIVCERIEPLNAIAAFLERYPPSRKQRTSVQRVG